MLEERGSKVNVTGVSCPDPLDRIKNDSSLCKLKVFAKNKNKDLNLITAKGGHSWPPIMCEEKCRVCYAAISVQRFRLGEELVFETRQPEPLLNL